MAYITYLVLVSTNIVLTRTKCKHQIKKSYVLIIETVATNELQHVWQQIAVDANIDPLLACD
ncbi:hypothetical protein CAP31_01585 [Sulfuriferula sp. AH1]|nr:hypothetical protein CAP31_01585 [Sulfuriferula sp. AH1]